MQTWSRCSWTRSCSGAGMMVRNGRRTAERVHEPRFRVATGNLDAHSGRRGERRKYGCVRRETW